MVAFLMRSCSNAMASTARSTATPSRARGLTLRVQAIAAPPSRRESSQPTERDEPPAMFGADERVLDIAAMLREFDPLNGGNVLVWGSSDEDDEVLTWEGQAVGDLGLGGAPWAEYGQQDGVHGYELTPEEEQLLEVQQPLSQYTQQLLMGEQPPSAPAGPSPLTEGADAAPLPSSYSAEGGFFELPAHEVAERLATGQVALLLDVRSAEEYGNGHITGATNIPLESLSASVRSGQLDEYKTRPVIVVCASGSRSAQATVRLSKVLGFSNVTNATGGMSAWQREGLPVQQPIDQVVRQRQGGCGCGSSSGGGGGCKSGAGQAAV